MLWARICHSASAICDGNARFLRRSSLRTLLMNRDEMLRRCSKWTCSNTNACGGCTTSICDGPNPHAMCSDSTQPYCDARRCDSWCSSSPSAHCGRVECNCDFCAVSMSNPQPTARIQARVSPVPSRGWGLATGSCDADYLRQVQLELSQIIDVQVTKNTALKQLTAFDSVPTRPSVVSTPMLSSVANCLPLHTQCGGFNHKGATMCCTGMRCHVYNQYFSGCKFDDLR